MAAARNWRFPFSRATSGKKQLSNSSIFSLDQDHVAANMLADAVKNRWNDEAKARHLETPDVITVRWQGDDKLQSHTIYIDSAVTGRMDHIKNMVEQFLALAPHRLILVGPPGSGKTALSILMMLELLSRRTDQSAVPVMLSLSSWDLQGGLRVWVKRRIVSEYKPEAVDTAEWAAAVERLIQQDLIIPVLDGLDELATEMRGPAMRAINTILPAQPMILACRREEYCEISQRSGPLKNAAASVALPVEPSAVASFLGTHSGAQNSDSWRAIVDEITSTPSSPLASALSRPLMVSLLPAVYDSPETDPSELLDRQRFGSPEAIEGRLYEGLLQSYNDRFHISLCHDYHWEPEQARKWLVNLAHHLSRSQIYDIVYWQLPHAINRRQRLLVALSSSLIGGIAAATISPLILGLAAGAACGLLVGALASLMRRKENGPKARLLVTSGKAEGSFIRGNGPVHTAVFSGLVGLLAGMLMQFIIKTYVADEIAYSAYITCAVAVIAGTPIGIPGWQPMIVMKEHDSSRTPLQQLTYEKANNLLFAIAAISALAIAVLLSGWFYGGLATGFLLGSSAAFIIEGVSMAWWSYLLATIILAASGTFPLRLAKFLQDSYEYGLLRRVGGVYQFRHAGFQDYLARLPDSGVE